MSRVKVKVSLFLDVGHVDGPRRDPADVADAVADAIAGETIEMLTHEAFPARSRYLVEDAIVEEAS